MDRQTSYVEGVEDNGNIAAFPSNYDPTILFLAVNDDFDADNVSVASILLNRMQVAELIAALSNQLVYMTAKAEEKVAVQ